MWGGTVRLWKKITCRNCRLVHCMTNMTWHDMTIFPWRWKFPSPANRLASWSVELAWTNIETRCQHDQFRLYIYKTTWQNLGPLLKLWLLVGHIENHTRLKRSKVLREYLRFAMTNIVDGKHPANHRTEVGTLQTLGTWMKDSLTTCLALFSNQQYFAAW